MSKKRYVVSSHIDEGREVYKVWDSHKKAYTTRKYPTLSLAAIAAEARNDAWEEFNQQQAWKELNPDLLNGD